MVLKCGPQSSSHSITWQLVGNANLWPRVRTSGAGPAMSSLTSLLGDSDAHWTLTPTGVAHCVSGQKRRRLVWLQAGEGQIKSGGVRCIKKHW